MMGGSTERGNIGIYGEFNVTIDPEAAKWYSVPGFQ